MISHQFVPGQYISFPEGSTISGVEKGVVVSADDMREHSLATYREARGYYVPYRNRAGILRWVEQERVIEAPTARPCVSQVRQVKKNRSYIVRHYTEV